MVPQLHTLHGSVEGLIPVSIRTPQSQEALDDLLRPAAPAPRAPRFLPVTWPVKVDWEAVGAASFIYALAFVVWIYLAK